MTLPPLMMSGSISIKHKFGIDSEFELPSLEPGEVFSHKSGP
ncbi:hypothetical protein SAMN05443529_11218 [Desulfosporosinus hippei DSM 8344]|uniref:Uncharacterized protein n=1 Tax=Desulfosporosinus hippei DSM 8344 TaxID=1121419 RepID=A0A1G8BEI7_9FIRM|nr:hypothetical protein SAMN05443529_11218 [Desulfosporosinus hippei DSM 8344]